VKTGWLASRRGGCRGWQSAGSKAWRRRRSAIETAGITASACGVAKTEGVQAASVAAYRRRNRRYIVLAAIIYSYFSNPEIS